jgi:hypothetical protein
MEYKLNGINVGGEHYSKEMSNSGKLVKNILLARKYIPYFRVNMFLYYYFLIEGQAFLATYEK